MSPYFFTFYSCEQDILRHEAGSKDWVGGSSSQEVQNKRHFLKHVAVFLPDNAINYKWHFVLSERNRGQYIKKWIRNRSWSTLNSILVQPVATFFTGFVFWRGSSWNFVFIETIFVKKCHPWRLADFLWSPSLITGPERGIQSRNSLIVFILWMSRGPVHRARISSVLSSLLAMTQLHLSLFGR